MTLVVKEKETSDKLRRLQRERDNQSEIMASCQGDSGLVGSVYLQNLSILCQRCVFGEI
jgi:hypothetical protein